jgi:hypothetical protein
MSRPDLLWVNVLGVVAKNEQPFASIGEPQAVAVCNTASLVAKFLNQPFLRRDQASATQVRRHGRQ